MKKLEANSISEYIDILKSIKKEYSKQHKEILFKEILLKCRMNDLSLEKNIWETDGYEMYYRGEPKDYKASSGTPGIARGGWLEGNNEPNLMRECERRLPNEFAECKSTFERLVKMQHYGIPTRLLDITLDPLVALFFALYKDPKNHDDLSKKDAVVLVYRVPKEQICNYRSDKVSVVSNISVYSYDDLKINEIIEEATTTYLDSIDIKEIDEKLIFNRNKSIKHLLHEIKSEKPHFSDDIDPNHLNRVFAVHPLLDNSRIRAQQGAFLLYGLNGNRHKLAELKDSEIIFKKIFIPYDKKKDLLKELILLGKTVDNIYPDWDGVSDFFRSFYNKDDFNDYYKSESAKSKLAKSKSAKSKSSEDSGVSKK